MLRFTSWVDHLAVRAVLLASSGSNVEALGPEARLARLAELERRFHRPEWLERPELFFGEPQAATPVERVLGNRWGREVVDLSWRSTHQTLNEETRRAYEAFPHNATATVRWFRSPRPRPLIVAIHGYGGGRFSREVFVFPVRRWLAAGFDVALPALPFHGARRAPGDKVRFPSALPPVTIEGFRQAVIDLQAFLAWSRGRGTPGVAVAGMSLGGYTASLLATVEPRLDAAMAYIPLASLAGYAARHRRFVGTEAQRAAQQAGLERVYAVVSPLGRPSRVPPDRFLVAGGRYDRICPITDSEQLASWFGSELVVFEGAHLLQTDRRRAWDAFDRRLQRAGLMPSGA